MIKREFQDNLADMTAAPALMAGALTGLSNDIAAALQNSGANTVLEAQFTLDQELARQANITDNDRLMGVLSGNMEGLTGLIASFAQEQRMRSDRERAAKARSANTTLSLLLLNDLRAFEANIAEDYGEDFAENLFADLHAQGAISDEDYQAAMAIDDPEARKRAIAERIQEGLNDGSIKPEELQGHPWAAEWLDRHEAYNAARDAEAEAGLDGRIPANEMTDDARIEASKIVLDNNATHTEITGAPDMRSAFEIATIGEEQSEQELEEAQEIAVNMVSQLDGLSV